MDLATMLSDLETALAAALPSRVITRNLRDPMERDDADLEAGVVTLVLLGVDGLDEPALEDLAGTARLVIAGQVRVAEDADPHAIEDAEIALFQEIRDFAAAPGTGLCPLSLTSVAFSGQLEHPYGWCRVEAAYAEID